METSYEFKSDELKEMWQYTKQNTTKKSKDINKVLPFETT